jgi:hypothetical protein
MAEQNLNQPNPDEQAGMTGQEGQEPQAEQEISQQQEQPQFDWESDENPYKKRYRDSQSQITPLVRTLQQFAEYDHLTKTWKPKISQVVQPQQPDEDFERILEGYDPEFKKALAGYTQKQIREAIEAFRRESAFLGEYNRGVQESRSRAMEEFGSEFDFVKNGKMNTESPLYQLANEIVVNKYSVFNPDGTFQKYTTPDAEYLATVEAYAILARRSKQQAQPQEKGKLSAIQGKGTRASGVKRELTYEEYSRLSDEEKDAYDMAQTLGK